MRAAGLTMRRIGLTMALLLVLGACEGMDLGSTAGQGIRTMTLLGGDVRVRGPEGYCIDRGASHARRGFAMLAGCGILAADAAIMPSIDGLITVQFGEPGSATVTGNEAAMAAFLETEPGRAMLAQDGDPAMVEVTDTRRSANRVTVRFTDAGGPVVPGTDGPVWRGFLDVEGRLVTLSVRSFSRRPLAAENAHALLLTAMRAVEEVNAPAAN